MIETRGLCKVFHDKKRGAIRAVDNVSLVCKPGQIYGLLGANGAGKTTALRMLATILEPTDGTAVVCGHDVVDEPDKVRANVGFLSAACGCFLVAGAALDAAWLMELRRPQMLAESIGRRAARWMVGLIGIALIVVGGVIASGWRVHW